MCRSCDVQIDGVWSHLAVGQAYNTPDAAVGVPFTISNITAAAISIAPQNIQVTRRAFSAALHHLRSNRHDHEHPCEIGSNNAPGLSGPLCSAARTENNDVRCINYILPILAELGVVGVNSSRLNTTWVMRCSQ